MVGVFSIFATLPILDMKEMGIGLAAAVLIDATIVRGVLLPASMKLLGDWNWYLPNWLHWLPKLGHHAEPRPSRHRPPPDDPSPEQGNRNPGRSRRPGFRCVFGDGLAGW